MNTCIHIKTQKQKNLSLNQLYWSKVLYYMNTYIHIKTQKQKNLSLNQQFWSKVLYYMNTYMLGVVTEIRREGRRNFGDQRTDVHEELCTLPDD